MNVRPAGDRAALYEAGDNATARRLARALRATGRFVDVVPGHCTVLVTWEGAMPTLEQPALDDEPEPAPSSFDIRVVYDGPDLQAVARLTGLSPEGVVARHVAPEYVVAFLGFAGLPYLLGGHPRLEVPRLPEPRVRVPAGSVAIGGPYSGVYPLESPGGWRLLGRTDLVLFDPARDPPALLAPGDRVRFRSA
jgi:KipI family sensor histidine kinase inhibitor